MAERGLIVYDDEEEIRAELDEIGCDGEAAELTPGPKGGFILTGSDAEELANHRGLVTTELKDLPGYTEGEAAPTLTSISPNTAVLGSADITMVCTGSGFTESSVIMFAENPEPVTFVSESEISTVVKPTLPWGAVSVPVTVKNGLEESEPQQFTFTAA